MLKLFKRPKLIIVAVLAVALLIISVLGGGLGEALGLGFLANPVPVLSLAAEPVFRIGIGGENEYIVTNSAILFWLTSIILIIVALITSRKIKEVPSGFQNIFEAILDFFGNIADGLGKGARKPMALVFLVFLIILVSNWFGLLPIVGSIGRVESAGHWLEERVETNLATLESSSELEHLSHDSLVILANVQTLRENDSEAFVAFEGDGVAFIPFGRGQQALVPLDKIVHYDLATLDELELSVESGTPLTPELEDAWHEIEKTIHDSVVIGTFTSSNGKEHDYVGVTAGLLVPYLRGPTTDLNTTLAFALVVMIGVQIFGIRALGFRSYGGKFIVLRKGPIWFMVGLLEIISELSRIVSFAFRLFGNIFAGEVLIFAMAFLLPLIGIIPFLGLEIFVGAIQAFIFATLALVFIYIAMQSHDSH